ncbi:uncharacterized protein SOCE26_052710 [Sorangium cellulosum]|uniref:Uncharacterized protein n=1 Tax=Sorangium cellulosum TaxID=56 RepID=A0A2L0EX02_SORCE|nr:hypothetical protein [Sorangium cellulosum]AUX43816.1 uncharacterized protein SOCE26_052710 [Sorangium cellulosum]
MTTRRVTRESSERVEISFSELARQLGEAYSRGASDMRANFDALGRLLEAREGTIRDQGKQLFDLASRFQEVLEKLNLLSEKTAQVVLLDAQKEIAIKRLESSASRDREILDLLKPVAQRGIALLGTGAAAVVPAAIKKTLERVLESEQLCAAIQAHVGTEAWVAFVEWAAALG